MVDSREKGARAEIGARDILRKITKLQWERVPGSGALNEKHLLKGDLYVPGKDNKYVIECKHYADDHLTSTILTGKNPQILEWWEQAIRQGKQVDKKPLLIYKFDRSKYFVAFEDFPYGSYRHIFVSAKGYEFYTSLLEDYLIHETPRFI